MPLPEYRRSRPKLILMFYASMYIYPVPLSCNKNLFYIQLPRYFKSREINCQYQFEKYSYKMLKLLSITEMRLKIVILQQKNSKRFLKNKRFNLKICVVMRFIRILRFFPINAQVNHINLILQPHCRPTCCHGRSALATHL